MSVIPPNIAVVISALAVLMDPSRHSFDAATRQAPGKGFAPASQSEAHAARAVSGQADGLSQQSCNTDCQERQTDCALRCDQDAPCIRQCRAEAEDCTARCTKPPAAPPVAGSPAWYGLLPAAGEAVWADSQP